MQTGRAPYPPALFDIVMGGYSFSTFAASYSMNDEDFRTVLDTGTEVARRLLEAWKKEPGSCSTTPAGFSDCARTLVSQRGPLFFRRPLTTEEITQYTATATKAAPTFGNDDAVLLMIEVLVLSPHFLRVRVELGEGTADAAGLVKLSPHELASAIPSPRRWPS